MGGSSRSCSSERPRKVRRDSASEASVPTAVATTAVTAAISTLFRLAAISLSLVASAVNQRRLGTMGRV